MHSGAESSADAPVWARNEAFPKAPDGWGWVDFKGNPHSCGSAADLTEAIRNDRNAGVVLAWSPAHGHMVLPEEVPGTASAVLSARRQHASADLLDARARLHWFGWLLAGLTVYLLFQGWLISGSVAGIQSSGERLLFALHGVVRSMSMGITLLMFLIFAFIPWYEARKRVTELARWSTEDLSELMPVLRFEIWLDWQKAPVTRILLGLITVVGLAQLLPGDSLTAAGLVKPAYLQQGEWWRLLTAPLMHGNLPHFLMNAAALLYLGKRMEVFARWPHVPLVFLFAAIVGGEASARFLATPSVGSSGGLMGWLGFLLVFESLHGKLVPRKARRRLLAGVALTAVIGLVGFRFIDNAAHAGGLFAGMLYAALVFPKSSSPARPRTTVTDRVMGSAALGILILAALLAVTKILAV